MEKQARQDVDLFGYEKMVEGKFLLGDGRDT
jgi:hypothetical protein